MTRPAPARDSVLKRIRQLVQRVERLRDGDPERATPPDLPGARSLHMAVVLECMRAQIGVHEVGLRDLPEDAATANAPERRHVVLAADQVEALAAMEAHFGAAATCPACAFSLDLPCPTHRCFILAGPAGSGKSTVAGEILRRYAGEALPAVGWRPSMVAMAAPTNVAALRLLAITGRCAGTYHSIAYERPVVDTVTGELLGFVQREQGGADIAGGALLILDEASMASEKIRDDLLTALPRTVRILVIGDPCQLPPVKAKPGFDLAAPDFMLTQIHRQADGSALLDAVTTVREKKLNLNPQTVAQLGGTVLSTTWASIGYALALGALQPGCPGSLPVLIVRTNKSRYKANVAARKSCGYPEMDCGPQRGERVIAFSTNHGLNIANGEQGTVRWAKESQYLVGGESCWLVGVEWDGRGEEKVVVPRQSWHPAQDPWNPENIAAPLAVARARAAKVEHTYRLLALQPAYAVTVHKAQGLEYDHGAILLESHPGGSDDWRATYTAITRFRHSVQFLQAGATDRPRLASAPHVAPLAPPTLARLP